MWLHGACLVSEADEGISRHGLDFWFAGRSWNRQDFRVLSCSLMGGVKVQLRQRLQTRCNFPFGFQGLFKRPCKPQIQTMNTLPLFFSSERPLPEMT
ncbi:hypothetical protein PsAD46_04583 [Pseudovibrio sp. Ad46]|nr:hypothetical protein PsAD46_04583 [Pseudovibrio sp. Ad46]KZK93432.1 hypothetical protein PsAD5_03148 [Pseudovibrio sp. Ad5]